LAEPRFDRAAFESRLRTRIMGRHLIARAETESTNDVAWEALAQGLPDGTTAVADVQTRGRGRAGRSWQTEPGKGLALSLLMHAGCAPARVRGAAGGAEAARGVIPLAAGLALARALERLGARAELKWPNDLQIGGRKVAGILCESRSGGAGGPVAGDALVIGVGVNVGEARADFAGALADSATSLAIEGCATTREAVAAELLNALEPLWNELEEGDPAAVLAAWRERATFWGRTVRVRTPAGDVSGVATALDSGGGLVIERAGEAVTVVAGDLELTAAPESA
jgi:BirA family transcriptional regulator, biotin operon repressor / biotin---[acetyl-CoA-carboxylase] ligase